MCNFHVCKWKNAYIEDLNALRILMNFLCIYIGEKGGGVALYIYIWEHIVSLYYRTAEWMLTKLGRDEVLMARQAHALRCIGHICPGVDPGRGKIGHMGGPLLQKTSSSDCKATATNRIHSNDLEACVMKCFCF